MGAQESEGELAVPEPRRLSRRERVQMEEHRKAFGIRTPEEVPRRCACVCMRHCEVIRARCSAFLIRI